MKKIVREIANRKKRLYTNELKTIELHDDCQHLTSFHYSSHNCAAFVLCHVPKKEITLIDFRFVRM